MENGAKTGYVHSLESFGSVDGPGVRYVIFLSGCAMRCQFCHNPDTWNMTAGKSYTADALLKQAVKYRTYWGNKGGITVSGGEPLLQIDFLIELFRKAKEMGIHTTLDTSGNPYTEKEPFYSKWLELMKYTDLILLDIKHIDEQEHIKLTGQTNKNILAMAEKLSDKIYEINSAQRKELHLAAVFACNFPNYLYSVAGKLLENSGLPFSMLRPLIFETAHKVMLLSPEEAQTGPARRGDESIMSMHKNMLKGDKELLKIYTMLSEAIRESQDKEDTEEQKIPPIEIIDMPTLW